MRIEKIEDFHADGGWQVLSFLKITASDGTVGWSEFNGHFSGGLTHVVRELAATVIGRDPRDIARLWVDLNARARPAAGGLNAQAAAAIENACLDLKGKAFGVPVHELLGGAVHTRVPVYWSHCGMYRLRRPDLFAARRACVPRSMADMAQLGREVAERGMGALKTNLLSFPAGREPQVYMPGFGRGDRHPALHTHRPVMDDAVELVRQLKHGAGAHTGVMLDLNFNLKPEGVRQIAAALEPVRPDWLEVDGIAPDALALIRQGTRIPIASLEAVYGRAAMLPYLQAQAVDVAVIDPMWNGFTESLRMAALADSFGVNVASHLYSGALATAMCAHFCAAVPNLRIMEADIDRVAWHDELFIGRVEITDGHATVPPGPGWGVAVNEAALARHPAAA